MATQGGEPQPNSVDAFNPACTVLGQVFKPVLAASTKPTDENKLPPYDALIVPEEKEARDLLISRLLALFANSSAKNFNPEQMDVIRQNLERAMPDPEKDPANFAQFVQDRCHGVLEMLRLLFVLQSKGAKKSVVIAETAVLGADYLDPKSGLPKPIKELTGGQRDDAICSRVGRIRDLGAALEIKAANDQLYPQVVRKYARFSDALTKAFRVYGANVEKFANKLVTPEYARVQWLNVLLGKLDAFDTESPDTAQQLERLEKALGEAQNAEAFMTAINRFGSAIN